MHPGYWEGILIQGARQFAGIAMFAALAIALGGDHLVIGIVAAIPFLARLTHLGVPALNGRILPRGSPGLRLPIGAAAKQARIVRCQEAARQRDRLRRVAAYSLAKR